MFSLDAERAHELGMLVLRSGVLPNYAEQIVDDEILETEVFGLRFANPLGMAAGFDKNAVAVDALARLGFGFVETGTVTIRPQPGNEMPRLFRLPKDKALVNRLGFNNKGAKAAAENLRRSERKCIIGVNIGKNKDVPLEEAAENYLQCFEAVHGVADYIAVNISSPNTPGLRELQKGESLEELLRVPQTRNTELGTKPLLVKIAPDLTEAELEAIADGCVGHNIAGMIATNTTIGRDGLLTDPAFVERIGAGGLSGKPVFDISNRVIETLYKKTSGKMPIIGVGGVFTAEDAFRKIAAGASLVQAYTGFIYGGPSFAKNILKDLARILKEKGFNSINEAVGIRNSI
jgi:dihydroorotate dehydrogenase